MGCGTSTVQVLDGPQIKVPPVEKEIQEVEVVEDEDRGISYKDHPVAEINTADNDEQPIEKGNKVDLEVVEDQGSVDENEESSPLPPFKPELPPVQPPKTPRKHVFKAERYEEVDNRAKAVESKFMYGSLEDLVRHLTDSCPTDMSKLRSLFTWLTSIDIPSLEHVVETLPDPHTPLDFLLKLHWRLTNYAYFFAQLCWIAQLPCYVIDGINKSAAYKVGDAIERECLAAQWNGVLIDGQWRLLDVFWASTCVVGRQSSIWSLLEEDDVTSLTSLDEEGHAEHVVNEFFFIPDPDKLSWTHLPNDHQWQLTDETISFEEFQRRVYLRERFFDLEINLPDDQKKCMIFTKGGELTLKFGVPPSQSENYQFKYLLYKQSVNTSDEQKFASLDQFVYFTKMRDHVLYHARFPIQGLFRMDIYGRDVRRHETFDLACSYVIQCSSPKPRCQPLPDNPEIGWGPGVEIRKAGLNPISHDEGNIVTEDGKVQLRFKMKNAPSILQNLQSNDLDEWLLRRHAVVYTEGSQLVIDIRLPSPGEYALNLFGQPDEADGLLSNVCNYLIHCTNTSNNEPFPKMHEGVLGPGEDADALGIEHSEELKSIIKTDGDSKSIKFHHPDDVELFCELYHSDNDRLSMADKVTRIVKDGASTFKIDVGIAGLYGVNVYARRKNSDDNRLYHVHTYLIDNTSDSLHSFDIADDEGLDVEVFELVTNTKNNSVTIPRYTKAPVNLVAELRQRYAKAQNDHQRVRGKSNERGNTFDVTLPNVGEYTLDVYQALETGALIHKVVYLICREEGHEKDEDYDQYIQDKDEKIDEDDPIESGNLQTHVDPEEVARMQKEKIREEKQRLIRQQMKDAIRSRDEAAILEVIENLKDAGVAGDSPEVIKAEDFIVYLRFSEALQSAMAARDLKELEKLVQKASYSKVAKKMGLQLAMSRRIIDQLYRIQELRHDILTLDQTTVAELKSYANPPRQVHMVMTGTLVLLGEPEYSLKKWKSVQAMMGKTGKASLKRRVSDFRADSVSMDIASAAKRILSQYEVDEVRDVSAGAATFFVWSMGMIEEIENIQEQHGGPTLVQND